MRRCSGTRSNEMLFKPAVAPSAPNPRGSGEQRWGMLGGVGAAGGSWGNGRGMLGDANECQGVPEGCWGDAGTMLGGCWGHAKMLR